MLRALGDGQLAVAEEILAQMERDTVGPTDSPQSDLTAAQQSMQAGNLHDAVRLARRALDAAAASGRQDAEAAAAFLLGQALLGTGSHAEAIEVLERSARILEEKNEEKALAVVSQVIEIAKKGRTPGDASAESSPVAGALSSVLAALKSEQPDEALRALEAMPSDIPPSVQIQARLLRAQALALLRRYDDALAEFDEVLKDVASRGDRDTAEAVRRLQDQLRTQQDFDRLADTSVDQIMQSETTATARALRLSRKATADLLAGRPDAAAETFAAAEREAKTTQDLALQLNAKAERMSALHGFGESELARAMLGDARALANQLGAKAQTMVEELGKAITSSPPATGQEEP